MNNYSPLITVLTGNNLAHSSCVGSERITTKYYFFRSQLLTKNYVLKPSKVRYLKSGVELSHLAVTSHLLRNTKVTLSINTPFVTVTVTTVVTLEPSKHCHTKNSTTVLLVSLLASCQPSYAEVEKPLFGGNSDFVEQLNKISYLLSISEDFSLISNSDFLTELNKINQLSFFDGFNCLDLVAVSGNNARQELQNLFVTVQHHTIVDVFLCLSFANCLFTGELRLALALVRLWWGGDGNKPFIRQIPSAVVTAVLNLPAALYLGLITQTSLPVRKVL